MDEKRLLESIGVMMKAEMADFRTEIKTEVTGLKKEINGVKAEMTDLKKEVKGVKTEITGLKKEIKGVKVDLADFKKEVKVDMEGLEQRFKQEIKAELEEPKQILRALEHSAEVNRADHDVMKLDIAYIKGDLESLKKKVLAVEAVTAENWREINSMKLADKQ